MPKPYEDDYRNTARDDIAGALAARPPGVSVLADSVGRGLQNVGSRFASGAPALGNMPATAVPAIGAGGSVLPTPPAQLGMRGAMPMLGTMPGLPQMPELNPQSGLQRRRY